MITLLQLLKLFPDQESRDGILSWCEMIEEDPSELEYFIDYLDYEYGIQMVPSLAERLGEVCAKGTYKSAFNLL